MLTLALISLLAGKPDAGVPLGKGPGAAETARLYFLAGDISKAQEFTRGCIKSQPKLCKPLNAWLAEYAYLIGQDPLTPEQVRALLDFDHKIAPLAQSKLTKKVVDQYVTRPFELAKARANGDEAGALKLLDVLLSIDPKHEGALALQRDLRNRADAGP